MQTPLGVDVSITQPRFMWKRLNKGKHSTAPIYRKTLYDVEPGPSAPFGQNETMLTRAIASLKVPKVKEKGGKQESSSTGMRGSVEGFVTANLGRANASEGDVMSAVLMLIAPPPPLATSNRVGSADLFEMNRYSGNAFVRVLWEGRDMGKLYANVSNALAVLIVLQVVFVSATLGPTTLPQSLDLGTSVPISLRVMMAKNLTTKFNALSQPLIGEAQIILRDALVTLVTDILKFPLKQPSLLSQIMRVDLESQFTEKGPSLASANISLQEDQSPSSTDMMNDDLQSEPTEELDAEIDESEIQRRNNVVFGENTRMGKTSGIMKCSPHPNVFTSELRKYQQIALDWMRSREISQNEGEQKYLWDAYELKTRAPGLPRHLWLNCMTGEPRLEEPREEVRMCRGGLLADEMGLGKTVEMLALISEDIDGETGVRKWKHNVEPIVVGISPKAKKLVGGTLVVLPLSLVGQWNSEISRHMNCSKFDVRVHRFYGPERNRSTSFLISCDIVLTTYGTILSEARSDSNCLAQIYWNRIILDEAHYIKSRFTRTAKAVYMLKSLSKWAVTGTPIQNSLSDLFSLFHFLSVEPWGHYSWWMKLIADEQCAVRRVQMVTEDIMIRRSIHTIDPATGQTIVTLPPKTVVSFWLKFDEFEKNVYQQVFTKALTTFEAFLGGDGAAQNSTQYTSVLHMLLRLRQVCNHPLLIYSHSFDQAPSKLANVNDIENLTQQFLKSLQTNSLGPSEHHDAGVKHAHETFIKNQLRRIARDRFSRSPTLLPMDTASEKPGGTVTPPAEQRTADLSVNASTAGCPVCFETPEDPMILHCGHILCSECITEVLRHSAVQVRVAGSAANLPGLKRKRGHCPVCRVTFTLANVQKVNTSEIETREGRGGRWLDVLDDLLFDQATGRMKLSAKLRCLLFCLSRIVQSGYRVVVFSQWVTFLDLVDRALHHVGVRPCRLDGSHNATQRAEQLFMFCSPSKSDLPPPPPLQDFLPSLESAGTVANGEGKTVKLDWSCDDDDSTWLHKGSFTGTGMILLASLKAGGVGLNLVAANYLFLMDAWWNPATEEQALQRVHRIGQENKVIIFRLYVKNTVEEKILALHAQKEQRAKGVLGESPTVRDVSSTRSAWSMDDLKMLFLKQD